MSDDLNFDRARYTGDPAPYVPEPAPIPEYYRVNSADSGAFTKAILYGIGAAIVSCLLYATFTIVTHIEIGYVALGVGYLVGKAMMAGSGNRGGRNYQIAACILTYLAVSMAAVPEILWHLHSQGSEIHLHVQGVLILAKYGVASPFLALTEGVGGIIGLFILFIALRAAWRLTSANANTAHHPFTAS